ncbi:ketopantoate reductase family protein [Candidatus Viridilinea mediisalina]|uniref:2-dehydropantoate 2-reductase n=1 Tax=Candidatus Viridilinea mediisalina TaxID=2024553 RepID=A0A2A6RFN6_9CHLR|nr:2-dehydropantoate 2-reductase [Candidatus Viridilinea mediisalina]PDW01887.1 2-dehydropantoate 2-reductase [Candidatus Viridilinea mediisalina]
MSIVIVGGGAIGLQMAGRLTLGGVPCMLLGRGAGTRALATSPLTLTLSDGPHTAHVRAAASLEELPVSYRRPALAILCVKSYDTRGALATLRALEPEYVLSLQNGLGNEEQLVAEFGAQRVLAGVITTSVEMRSDTWIVITKTGGIALAPLEHSTTLNPWVAALREAGFPVRCYADYRALKWSKALINMFGNAQAAILDLPVHQIYADPRLVDLDLRAARETLGVMRDLGVRPLDLYAYPAATLATLERFAPEAVLRAILRRMVGQGRGGKEPSLLRDLRAAMPASEGEHLYGAVASTAAARGIITPVNAALWRILGGIVRGELAWDDYRGQPERLLAEVWGQ